MQNDLLKLKNDASSLILSSQDEQELNEIKLSFLGKNGKLTLLIKELKNVPRDERPEIGRLANEIILSVEDLIKSRENELKKTSKHSITKEKIDITMPGIKPPLGHLHLITQAIEEISAIFGHIGFSRVRYPEVEWDYFAFESLNFPKNHPARDDWETFFIENEPSQKYGPMLLTPHTSSGQVREMLSAGKSASGGQIQPIKMLNIAKCYRRQSDVSHTQMFHQFEGLVVGKNISIVNLKGVLEYFVKSYFGQDRLSRVRPYHFQFTEPSFEVDVSCGVCKGKGKLENGQNCKLCKEGWLEMGGAGMVHPQVLRNGGIDPNQHSGFAFGWGVERVLMMKEGLKIDDLRLLYSNNLEFLEQF